MAEAFLAIECSHGSGSVALRPAAGAPIDSRAVPAPDLREDHLLAEIDALVRAHGLGPAGIAAIAVSQGPGGFTGLRVSCATAMAIAEATGCALVAVPSALVVARDAMRRGAAADGTLSVVLAAKARDAWCTEVRLAGGMPELGREALLPLESVRGLSGTVIADLRSPGSGQWAPAAVQATWSAAACLEVGECLRAAGSCTAADALFPRYPRRPEAELLWESRRGREPSRER